MLTMKNIIHIDYLSVYMYDIDYIYRLHTLSLGCRFYMGACGEEK